MVRSDTDSWDLTTSVGVTATMVAALRALASEESGPLINDPFAAPLVRAVGVEFFTRLGEGEIALADLDGQTRAELQRETDSVAVRTRFFDDFFLEAAHAGVRQSVILAAGLDTRPYRLAWPLGSVVYEIDQPKVVEFKTATMSALGAAPIAEHRTVSIDLRGDWPDALCRSGFKVDQLTAWSAEGLLMYLPPDAQDRLFDNITTLSGPGSLLATEYHPDGGPEMAERASATSDRWADFGCDANLSELFYHGERSNVVDYLSQRGWQVSARTRTELFAEYDRTFADDNAMAPFRNVVAVTATLL